MEEKTLSKKDQMKISLGSVDFTRGEPAVVFTLFSRGENAKLNADDQGLVNIRIVTDNFYRDEDGTPDYQKIVAQAAEKLIKDFHYVQSILLKTYSGKTGEKVEKNT